MAVTAITDQEFNEKVSTENNKAVLVDFWAEWCGPCKMLAPTLEQVSTELSDSLECYKLDTESNPETASKYSISSIPCCIIFKNGNVVCPISIRAKISAYSKNQAGIIKFKLLLVLCKQSDTLKRIFIFLTMGQIGIPCSCPRPVVIFDAIRRVLSN